jgi:uncharacterized protein (TIGR00251 family)
MSGTPARKEAGEGETRLTVQVLPRASRNGIVAVDGTTLRVRVTAPPADGAANQAVRDVLAEALDCPRSAVTILRGRTARTKLVGVTGLSRRELLSRLVAVAS